MDAPSETSGLAGGTGLHRGTLDNGRVFGQSVAGVGPSLGAVALIPVAYASAGAGGWLTVVIGTLGVLAVAASVTIMARRNATAGALYHMNAHGLGRWAGFVTGVSLIALVTLILPFIALGFAQALSTFSDAVGIGAFSPGVVLVFELVCVVAGGACAYLDVRISTTLFLIVELVSMVLILAVLIVVLAHSPKIFDHAQLTLHGASVHGVLVGVVIIVLAFVGFEGATSLGLESRTPERAIPIALIGAVLAIGAFFTFNAYVQTLGFANLHLDITQEAAPLSALAQHYNVPALGDVVLLGVAASWFQRSSRGWSTARGWCSRWRRKMSCQSRSRVPTSDTGDTLQSLSGWQSASSSTSGSMWPATTSRTCLRHSAASLDTARRCTTCWQAQRLSPGHTAVRN